ncbi:MAG: putative porin [Selenomonas sp.]|uniref:putative porin n=1 Tax=Selenomonas sp. TaxID=2053611 RepID=UPI0025D7E54C|nr:putative porin [Selenomonas sp.]MCR5756735.1 putative porin [Selenomonas sp.]
MKKTLVSALTTALVVGAASTTFAAANPFSDVPADHWAYDAVSQLAADGVIEGYGDSTFKGNRNITRYEMAQMVAKAMAKSTSGADKALVDKLAAEFAEELNNLGVRVSNLERNADMVKWNGKAEYTYTHDKTKFNAANGGGSQTGADGKLLFRLEPTAEVNSNWHVKARLDATTRAQSDGPAARAAGVVDNEDRVQLKRLWAQGDYDKLQVKLGKFSSWNDDAWADHTFTGAEVSYGKDVKGVVGFGRLNRDSDFDASNIRGAFAGTKNASVGYQYVGVEYNKDKLNAGIAYHRAHVSNGAFGNNFSRNGLEDTMNLFGIKAGYAFSKNVALNGWYAQSNADTEKKAASIEVDYKGAQQENKGTWGAWVAYRHMGSNAAFNPGTFDAIGSGEKGWEIGGNYTVLKNIVATLRYGKTKDITGPADKYDHLFGRVEFFF